MDEALMNVPLVATLAREAQTDTDTQLIALWLHAHPASTQAAYTGDIARFLAHVEKPLRTMTLEDVQAFADSLSALAPATTGRYLHARPTESSSKYLAV